MFRYCSEIMFPLSYERGELYYIMDVCKLLEFILDSLELESEPGKVPTESTLLEKLILCRKNLVRDWSHKNQIQYYDAVLKTTAFLVRKFNCVNSLNMDARCTELLDISRNISSRRSFLFRYSPHIHERLK